MTILVVHDILLIIQEMLDEAFNKSLSSPSPLPRAILPALHEPKSVLWLNVNICNFILSCAGNALFSRHTDMLCLPGSRGLILRYTDMEGMYPCTV